MFSYKGNTLCQMTADVNKVDGNGQTPLHKAAEKCTDKIIMCLLNKGADMEARNAQGATLAVTQIIRLQWPTAGAALPRVLP